LGLEGKFPRSRWSLHSRVKSLSPTIRIRIDSHSFIGSRIEDSGRVVGHSEVI